MDSSLHKIFTSSQSSLTFWSLQSLLIQLNSELYHIKVIHVRNYQAKNMIIEEIQQSEQNGNLKMKRRLPVIITGAILKCLDIGMNTII